MGRSRSVVDASPAAIEHLSGVAREEELRLTAVRADLAVVTVLARKT